MANASHLKILDQGVDFWNQWRQQNPDIRPDLEGSDLANKILNGIDLNNANLKRAKLIKTKLKGANLSRAEIQSADLSGAILSRADLSGAILNEAILVDAQLDRVDLLSAMLMKASLMGADLERADFTMANLHGANLNSARMGLTILSDTVLIDAKNLDTILHNWPSVVDHQTMFASGPLPLSFLRGCGLPESLIQYYPSLLGNPLEFYTCFISFTETDDLFAEKLYADLQGRSVRCWRWKEDARIGTTILRSIDEAIRVHDKVIVVCSKNSLQSPEVLKEIVRALQKEDRLVRENKDSEILFPIRLDNYVFEEWNHHLQADVIKKYIGDFREWKNHESYQKAFERLIRDLKTNKKV